MKIEIEPFNSIGNEKPVMDGEFRSNGNQYGPDNAKLHIKTRNPLDRVTQSAKEGGLHSFLEFSPGQELNVTISIRDPQPFDYKLLECWEKEIEEGMIRFGGLTGIGRGRVSFINNKDEVVDE